MLVLLHHFRKKLSLKKIKNLSIYYIIVNLLQVICAFYSLPDLEFWEEKENASRVVFPVKFKVTALPGLKQVHPLPCL